MKLNSMRYSFFFISILLINCSEKPKTFDDYTASIKEFQYNLNKEFSDPKESPLTEKDITIFKTLDFFPIDSTYKIHAKFTLNQNSVFFKMPTTTDRLPIYKTYGEATFTLHGEKLKLQVYQNQDLIKDVKYKSHLFIPFMDKTNNKETYGGGRYIDLEIPKGNTLIIDFNTAYNPYCVYNDKYSCPIPPSENDLDIEIKAGVKMYKQ